MTMPAFSMTTLFLGLIFGSVGYGYFIYGKKQQRPIPLIVGIALFILPYFIVDTTALIAAGAGLMAIPYFFRLR